MYYHTFEKKKKKFFFNINILNSMFFLRFCKCDTYAKNKGYGQNDIHWHFLWQQIAD